VLLEFDITMGLSVGLSGNASVAGLGGSVDVRGREGVVGLGGSNARLLCLARRKSLRVAGAGRKS
jgi:hypothetical protein